KGLVEELAVLPTMILCKLHTRIEVRLELIQHRAIVAGDNDRIDGQCDLTERRVISRRTYTRRELLERGTTHTVINDRVSTPNRANLHVLPHDSGLGELAFDLAAVFL